MSNSPITTPPPFSTIIENENEDENENENKTENENENKTENENENNKEENMRTSIFKISNQAITRRLTISKEQPTWLELELKVREIFSIPSSVSPGLTYIDEGDDNITISSQIELEDYYKQVKCHDYSDNNIIYRFHLVIFTPIRDFADDENDGGNNPPVYEEHEEHNVRVCPTQ